VRRFIFADECGDFTFVRTPKASRYYIICTIALVDPDVGQQLLRLRRDLIWEGFKVPEFFHCSEDPQRIRDRVFATICKMEVLVGATIFEKAKAQPQTRGSNERFYKYCWHYHLRYCARKLGVTKTDEVMITAATIATKKSQAVFTSAVNDVVQQHIPGTEWKTFFCASAADPCLQIADYFAWAIQRKWERNDTRSYDLVQHLVRHEYESWRHGTVLYY
jgi:hypothetical protein